MKCDNNICSCKEYFVTTKYYFGLLACLSCTVGLRSAASYGDIQEAFRNGKLQYKTIHTISFWLGGGGERTEPPSWAALLLARADRARS